MSDKHHVSENHEKICIGRANGIPVMRSTNIFLVPSCSGVMFFWRIRDRYRDGGDDVHMVDRFSRDAIAGES